MNNIEKIKLMNIQLLSIKTDCTNKFSILKLRENSLFHNFEDSLGCRNIYHPTLDSMENHGKPRKTNEQY